MMDLLYYFHPILNWIIFFWLMFSGALHAFINAAYGTLLRNWFERLLVTLDPWAQMVGWF